MKYKLEVSSLKYPPTIDRVDQYGYYTFQFKYPDEFIRGYDKETVIYSINGKTPQDIVADDWTNARRISSFVFDRGPVCIHWFDVNKDVTIDDFELVEVNHG